MPQEFNTFDRLTVEENIAMMARIYGRWADVREVMEKVGLLEMRRRKFSELSGGNKRRVGIAMALVSNPEVIFLDEPTTGLDPRARQELWGTIRELKREGVTVFLTTHYMEEVEALADRVSLIVDGQLLATGPVDELISRYGGGFRVLVRRDPRLRRVIRRFAAQVLEERGTLVRVFRSKKDMTRALVPLYQRGVEAEVREPSMEDVFLNMVGGRIDEHGELIT